jgi:hypothetical protein
LRNDYGILSYDRWNAKEKIAAAINSKPPEEELKFPIWKMECGLSGQMAAIFASSAGAWRQDDKMRRIVDGWAL